MTPDFHRLLGHSRGPIKLVIWLVGACSWPRWEAQAGELQNPYGLASLWAQGDGIARFTLLVLLVMSVLTWYYIVQKAWAHRRFSRDIAIAMGVLTDARDSAEFLAKLPGNNCLRRAHLSLLDETPSRTRHSGQERSHVDVPLQITLVRLTRELQQGQTALATASSTAPFVGLFGTVWGIYHALIKIGTSGSAALEQIAGPVGEALVMTAFGLAVAIPAALAYNVYARSVRTLSEDLELVLTHWHALLTAGVQK